MSPTYIPIVENHMEKQMENDMDIWIYIVKYIGYGFPKMGAPLGRS